MDAAILTIGVYGFTPERFFSCLIDEKIDLFCDVRARRGLRGSEYAFANSRRLQDELARLGIAYRHFPGLAPTPSIRAAQHRADAQGLVSKRQRTTLGSAFHDAYSAHLSTDQAAHDMAAIRSSGAVRPVLFCVERSPLACHRSILAEALANGHTDVRHITP